EKPLELPESGNLAELSPVRLYALAALTNASGWLQLELDQGRMLQISFRRGTPEHLSTDDPDLSLVRFLQQGGVVTAKSALAAEAIRRVEVPPLRARLGRKLLRTVQRSGGLGVGKVEELALNAQETRVYSSIDGTKTGEELLKAQDAAVTIRLLYLLVELGH